MGAEFRLEWAHGEPDRFITNDPEFAQNWELYPQKVMRSARRRAPRDTGELRRDITTYTGVDDEGRFSDVGTHLLKGRFQELGHKALDGTRVSPRRFLRPALRSLRRGKGR